MEKEKYAVHIRHCCAVHGCKYGNEECPVESGEVKQDYACEYCADEGIQTVEELQEYMDLLEQVKTLKKNGTDTMTVQVDLLYRILVHAEQ